MENKYQKLLNEMVTGWENTLENQEAREIELLGSGNENNKLLAGAIQMTNDQLRYCIKMTRQLMTDCNRMDSHESKITEMINSLTK